MPEGLHCLKCIEEHITGKLEAEKTGTEFKPTRIEPAFTMVPTWQQTAVGNQMMMACVPVPVCFDHITYNPPSPQQTAAANGRLVLPN